MLKYAQDQFRNQTSWWKHEEGTNGFGFAPKFFVDASEMHRGTAARRTMAIHSSEPSKFTLVYALRDWPVICCGKYCHVLGMVVLFNTWYPISVKPGLQHVRIVLFGMVISLPIECLQLQYFMDSSQSRDNMWIFSGLQPMFASILSNVEDIVGRAQRWNKIEEYGYPLVIWHSFWKWPFIVDFPIKNGDFL